MISDPDDINFNEVGSADDDDELNLISESDMQNGIASDDDNINSEEDSLNNNGMRTTRRMRNNNNHL